MAIIVKYRMDFKDQFQGDDFRVDFETEYGGSVIGLGHTIDSAFELNYNNGDDWIIGSEAVMSFYVNEDDIAAYDADFYDSNYKDIKVKYYVNSILKWVGWLKPENTTREFLFPEVVYRVSATDGLKDLQDVDYTGFQNTGKQTGLQLIKNAINFNGIDDLDFLIQCNLFEDVLMTAGENVFAEIQGDNEEFYNVQDGENQPDRCFTVLEKVIKPYYCQLYQADGYWRIVNGQEYVSEFDIFDYSALTQTTGGGAIDRTIDITNYDRPNETKFELSKNPSIKKLRILFRNKNLGANEIGTNPDFEDGGSPPSGWSNSGWDSFSTTTLPDGNKVGNTTESSTNADSKFITASSFTLSGVDAEQDSVLTSFRVKVKSITFSSPGERVPVVFAELVDPNSDTVQGNNASLSEVDGEFVTITDSFPVTIDGTYSLRLYVVPHATSPTSQLTYYWDDVFASHSTTSNTTTDSLYVCTSASEGYKEVEEEIFFADSLQNSDIGALTDGATLTTSWTRFDFAPENTTLAELFAQQYLNDFQAYHDLLRVDLYDVDEEINFNSILTFNSKSYTFSEYSKNSMTKLVSATLRQVDNSSDVSFTFLPQTLLSAFGESSQVVEFDTTGFATQAWALSQFGSKGQTEEITGLWDFTNGTGLKVGGTAFTATSIANWNTAYGWGNHAGQGYVTATVSVGEGGTGQTSFASGNILLGNGGGAINSVGQNTAFNKSFGTTGGTVAEGSHNHDVAYVNVSGDTMIGLLQFDGHARWNDSEEARFGTGTDWRLYSAGTHLYLDQRVASTNDFYIRNTNDDNVFFFDISDKHFHCDGEITAYSTSVP